jgi:CRP-like cAMP-binding protein
MIANSISLTALTTATATPRAITAYPLSRQSVDSNEMQGADYNDLLAALPHAELNSSFQQMECIELRLQQELFTHGRSQAFVYFPTTALVSLQYVVADGFSTEVAMVGREGMIGAGLIADEGTMCSATVQRAGRAYRLKTQQLRDALGRGGVLPQLCISYINTLFTQMLQKTGGARHGSTSKQLCGWLLHRLDHSATDELQVTQQQIGYLLGVRRETITEIVGKLQQENLIQCRRGYIKILDRTGLARCAGNSYRVAKPQYLRLAVGGYRASMPLPGAVACNGRELLATD